MTNDKDVMTINIELLNDWFVLINKISDVILPTSFMFVAKNISVKEVFQNKNSELSLIISKEELSSEYVDYFYKCESIDFLIRKVKTVIGLLPEEISILFLDKRCQFPTECIKANLYDTLNSYKHIRCVLNVMFDENVILISVCRTYLKEIRDLLKKYDYS